MKMVIIKWTLYSLAILATTMLLTKLLFGWDFMIFEWGLIIVHILCWTSYWYIETFPGGIKMKMKMVNKKNKLEDD